MKPIYVVTIMNDSYETKILGAFFTHAEAVEAIKKNIFHYVDDGSSCFDTTNIPEITYQIHETKI